MARSDANSPRPWSRNIPQSLLKEPKLFLWDWSMVDDPGARAENLVASHLIKAVHWWQDTGLGEFALHDLRTSTKREVDFVVTRDGEPWFLVEVKCSHSQSLSRNLEWFQRHTGAKHAFQVGLDGQYVEADAFAESRPIKVPARSFLSQLV